MIDLVEGYTSPKLWDVSFAVDHSCCVGVVDHRDVARPRLLAEQNSEPEGKWSRGMGSNKGQYSFRDRLCARFPRVSFCADSIPYKSPLLETKNRDPVWYTHTKRSSIRM